MATFVFPCRLGLEEVCLESLIPVMQISFRQDKTRQDKRLRATRSSSFLSLYGKVRRPVESSVNPFADGAIKSLLLARSKLLRLFFF